MKTVISGSILRLLGFSLLFQSQIPTSLTGDLFAGTSCKVKDLSSLLLETFSGVTIAGKGKVKLANLQQAWSPILLALGYTFAEFNAIFRTPHSRRTLLKDNGLLPADCEANTSPDLTAVTALAKSKTPTGAATGAAGQQDKQQTGTVAESKHGSRYGPPPPSKPPQQAASVVSQFIIGCTHKRVCILGPLCTFLVPPSILVALFFCLQSHSLLDLDAFGCPFSLVSCSCCCVRWWSCCL